MVEEVVESLLIGLLAILWVVGQLPGEDSCPVHGTDREPSHLVPPRVWVWDPWLTLPWEKQAADGSNGQHPFETLAAPKFTLKGVINLKVFLCSRTKCF